MRRRKKTSSKFTFGVIFVMMTILLMSSIPGNLVRDSFNYFARPTWSFIKEELIPLNLQTSLYNTLQLLDWVKVGHVIGYGLLGFFLYNAYKNSGNHNLYWPTLIVVSLACIDEIIQSYTPKRSSSISDIVIDTSSALIVMIILNLIKKNPIK